MKSKILLTALLATATTAAFAQTHKEGIEYYKADQHANSRELLQRNYNNAGTDKALSEYYLGRINYDMQKYADAKKNFEAGVSANPECPYNYVGLGTVALKEGDKKGAEAQFKLAEKFGKKNAEVAIDIARAYYDADPVAYAKEIAKYDEKARKYDSQDPSIYIFEGDMKKDQSDAGGAAGMYEMAANYDEQSAAAYVKYAKLFKDVNPQFSVRKLKELVQKNPTSALGQRELANAYYSVNDYANAAKEYGNYVQNPNHFKEDENRYAFLLFYNGEYPKGYEYATELLKENPSDFSAMRFQYMNACNIQGFDGTQLLSMAENLYKKHLENPADNALAQIDYNLIIQEMNQAERYDEAEAVAKEAVKEFPDVPDFKASLATVLVMKDQYQEAADLLNSTLANLENPSYAMLNRSALYNNFAAITLNKEDATKAQAQPYFENARKYAALCVDKDRSVRSLKLAGDMNKPTEANADVNNAVPYYEQAVALYEQAPKDADKKAAIESYLYLVGYYKANDMAKAQQYLNKVLALDPQNKQANAEKEAMGL